MEQIDTQVQGTVQGLGALEATSNQGTQEIEPKIELRFDSRMPVGAMYVITQPNGLVRVAVGEMHCVSGQLSEVQFYQEMVDLTRRAQIVLVEGVVSGTRMNSLRTEILDTLQNGVTAENIDMPLSEVKERKARIESEIGIGISDYGLMLLDLAPLIPFFSLYKMSAKQIMSLHNSRYSSISENDVQRIIDSCPEDSENGKIRIRRINSFMNIVRERHMQELVARKIDGKEVVVVCTGLSHLQAIAQTLIDPRYRNELVLSEYQDIIDLIKS